MQTFLSYSNFVSLELMRRQTHINRLAAAVANRLPSITFDKFAAIEDAAKRNQDFCKFLIFRFGVDSSHSIQFNSILIVNEMVSFYWASMGGREHEANQRGKKRNVHISQQHRNQAVLHSIHRGLSYDIFIIHLPSLYFAFTIGSDINIQLSILYTVYIFIALMFLSCLVEVPYFYYRCLLSLLFIPYVCLAQYLILGRVECGGGNRAQSILRVDSIGAESSSASLVIIYFINWATTILAACAGPWLRDR